ncbi:MAG: hypothetical protein AB9872_11315 [Solidesulfovibrio sp.]
MNPTAKKILAGLILFVSGVVMGYFGTRVMGDRGARALLQGKPEHFVDMTLHRMSDDLGLTDEQQEKLRPILLDTAKKLAEIRRDQEPKVHEVIEKSIGATKSIMTPEQLQKFEAIIERLKQRREAMERFGPPPPPHGMGPPGMDGFPPPPGMDGLPPPPGMDGFPPPPGMGPPPDINHFPGL